MKPFDMTKNDQYWLGDSGGIANGRKENGTSVGKARLRMRFLCIFQFVARFYCNICRAQVAISTRVCKLEAFSARFDAAISHGLRACLKLDANLKGFSENEQRYRTEIAVSLHVRFEVAALCEKNC